jgi:outer membrane PBP1 activator LpoA protein
MLRIIKFTALMVCTLLLSHCSKATELPSQPRYPKLKSPYTMSASRYLALAKNKVGSLSQVLTVKAAGRLIDDGQWREGLSLLSGLNDLSPDWLSKKKLLLAKVDLIRDQPQATITKLSSVQNITRLPLYYQAQFHEMLASAYEGTDKTMESVTERIKLDQILPDEASKANNRRALWLTLATLSMAELSTLVIEAPDDSAVKGWLQLALMSRQSYASPTAMLAEVQAWKVDHPKHSGHYILPGSLESMASRLFSSPKQLALLLPLTGPLAGPGHAIKDGFMSARAPHASKIRLYNTDNADVQALYQQAIDEGADYVVGPLSKANAMLIAEMDHPVPTLLLNDINVLAKEGAYQFGMSPSVEARQVAFKARQKGYTRALVIGPKGPWGDDIMAAFSHQWRVDGGRIVDMLHYSSNDHMNGLVRDFLRISDSEARKEQLKQVLGRPIESTPRRRQDFDVIFLLAYPSKAREIMPLLNYYYAGDVPVYATSSVYGGMANAMKDKDLDGVIFCDMPWVFKHQAGHKNWPEPLNSYNRLYAFGRDSYTLATELNQLLLFPAMGVSDNSGVLYLKGSQQIERVLAWGQFKHGLALQVGKPSVAF